MIELAADCGACAGLCCVAPAFARSADFALDKPAETPCPNLLVEVPGRRDAPCRVHAELPERGFPGCVVFDCFGAGQAVSARADWRSSPAAARAAFDAFGVLRGLHEMLWYLTEPLDDAPADLRVQVRAAADRVGAAAGGDPATVDVDGVRGEVGELLERVSAAVRRPGGRPDGGRPDGGWPGGGRPDGGRSGRAGTGPGLRRADLVGKDLRSGRAGRTALAGTTLRGALLVGADLRGVDLGRADLLGADLRGADLRGAHLERVLFLTTPQVTSARGDAATTVPARVRRPRHWH